MFFSCQIIGASLSAGHANGEQRIQPVVFPDQYLVPRHIDDRPVQFVIDPIQLLNRRRSKQMLPDLQPDGIVAVGQMILETVELEHGSNLNDLVDLLCRKPPNKESDTLPVLQQTIRGQLQQCIPNRHDADVILFCDLSGSDLIAGQQMPAEDLFLQHLIQLLADAISMYLQSTPHEICVISHLI